MKFHEQQIPGVYFIESEPFTDDRGMFRRHFCKNEFKSKGIVPDVCQSNVSENKFKHTLRGFHYQIPPYEEGKTMSCLKGAMYDIVVDLRPSSATYLKWTEVKLTEHNRFSVHIPPGCANAYLTLEDNTIIHYYCSEFYNPSAERGLRYNDPLFHFKWPVEPVFISEKDRNHQNFIPHQKA